MSDIPFDQCSGTCARNNGRVWIKGYHGQKSLPSSDTTVLPDVAKYYNNAGLNLAECCAPVIYYASIADLNTDIDSTTYQPKTDLGRFITCSVVSCDKFESLADKTGAVP